MAHGGGGADERSGWCWHGSTSRGVNSGHRQHEGDEFDGALYIYTYEDSGTDPTTSRIGSDFSSDGLQNRAYSAVAAGIDSDPLMAANHRVREATTRPGPTLRLTVQIRVA